MFKVRKHKRQLRYYSTNDASESNDAVDTPVSFSRTIFFSRPCCAIRSSGLNFATTDLVIGLFRTENCSVSPLKVLAD